MEWMLHGYGTDDVAVCDVEWGDSEWSGAAWLWY